ncbi:hypothetical protein [Sphingomonas sp. MMS24-J13]|uniref:hypothetical protein n=1 Tax=Sphingomonas sp. MMS24-J13 TaxID=3238686 RepID=UPI00384B36DE
MSTAEENISTEHQPKGAALNPSDTLDRENEDVAPGQRQWNADSRQDPDVARNASALPAGMADDGTTPQENSTRDEEPAEDGFADDGARSDG